MKYIAACDYPTPSSYKGTASCVASTVRAGLYYNTTFVPLRVAKKQNYSDRVDHQRSDTMHSRTLFPGIRTNVVRLLHTENVAVLVG